MTLSSLLLTVAATSSSTTLKYKSRKSFSTLALFFVATTASSAARAFSSSSTPATLFVPRHLNQQRLLLSSSSSTSNSVIYNTRGGSSSSLTQHSFVGKKLSLSKRFSSTQTEQEVGISEMDEVKAAASKTSAADKLALMRQKMEENGVDGTFYSRACVSLMNFISLCFVLPTLRLLAFTLDGHHPTHNSLPNSIG